MQTRLADIPEQIITKDTVYRNGVEVLRYFERDITEHTVCLQVDTLTPGGGAAQLRRIGRAS